jgi:hypothetical protein
MERIMNNSRRGGRVRLRPGLEALEDKCLLSQGTLGHLPRHAIEVHSLKAAQARPTPTPVAHAQKAKHALKTIAQRPRTIRWPGFSRAT